MAGGSQLKKLKESLKSAGLVNRQQPVKNTKKTKKTVEKMSKDDRQSALKEIRQQFNPFDVKVVRNKREDALSKKQTVGKPGISKQAGEDKRKLEWEAKMARKNKAGGIVDRRFGENNKHLSAEEKMLERFTKSKLAQANKRSIYNLDEDEDAEDGFNTLTHKGHSLNDDFNEDVNISDDDDDFFSKKRPNDKTATENEEPERKKTKAEVMKEVMAKSKYYKHLRQKAHEETMEKVGELDDDFDDVMDDIFEVTKDLPNQDSKTSGKDLNYEMKVTEAKLDKKSTPANRTKTQDEIDTEQSEKLKQLEDERQRRMEGEDLNDGDRGADDLDDDYWEANGDEGDEAEGFAIINSDEEFQQSDIDGDEVDVSEDETITRKPKAANTITIGNKVFHVKASTPAVTIPCPATLEEFNSLIATHINTDSETFYSDVIKLVLQCFEKYQPKLAEGNKEKLGKLSTVLLRYQLELFDQESELKVSAHEDYIKLMEFLSRTTKDLTAKYPSEFLNVYRELITNSHERLEIEPVSYPNPSDLLMLSQIGRTFSTSDKFHLVVVPTLILAAESLEKMTVTSPRHILAGVFICDTLLQYQRISKRFIPEVLSFLEKSLILLSPNPSNLEINKLLTQSVNIKKSQITLPSKIELPTSKEDKPSSISQLLKESSNNYSASLGKSLLMLLLNTLDSTVSQIWKETESIPEITAPFIHITQNLIKSTLPVGNPYLINLASKLGNINRIALETRKPLALQSHRAVAIATFAPKFDESFNPDNKHAASKYVDTNDSSSVNNEIAKLKYQIKQERKQTMRELRKDNKFEARVSIDKKKKDYAEYHSKMARIVNTIQAEEGTEKNLHEKEKKRRKDQKDRK